MRFLTKDGSIPIPAPPQMNNHGNYIISLNQFSKWLGERAEELGVEIYPGFAASEVLYKPNDGSVLGVATNDQGIARDGRPKPSFERGMEFHARVTLFAEGCHGSLTKQVIRKFDLRRDSQPQTYALGLKEVWEVKPENFRKGEVVHSMGYPLPSNTYGGGWIYHSAKIWSRWAWLLDWITRTHGSPPTANSKSSNIIHCTSPSSKAASVSPTVPALSTKAAFNRYPNAPSPVAQ